MKKFFLFALILATGLFFTYCSSDDDSGDGDANVEISINDVSVDEGNDYQTVDVQLTLSAAASAQVTALISSSDGTAEAGKDYIGFSNASVVFQPGEVQKVYSIVIAGDLVLEAEESFEVTITNVQGPATIADGTAQVTLSNDDVDEIKTLAVEPTIDWGALTILVPGSDIPYEVFNFGQPSTIPNAEYTSVTTVGDTIIFDSKISPSGDTILYFDLSFVDVPAGFDPEDYLDSSTGELSPTDSVFFNPDLFVISEDTDDLEFKYDITFYVGTPTGRQGPYTIDPKIRIQPK